MSGRIVIVGAGALGSVVGGLLAHAGEEVTLLAHGDHAAALARGPLELRLPDRTLRIEVEVAEDAAGDVVILTAKRFDSAAALTAVRGTAGLALSLQNGPGKSDDLVRRFGAGAVVGAASTTAARVVEPGVVASQNLGVTYIGSRHPGATALVAALCSAGIDARAVDGIEEVEWSKLAHVASSMAVQALVGLPLDQLFARRESACLVRRLIEEVGRVASADGSSIGDLPGLLPVGTLAAATDDRAATILAERAAALVRAGATALRTSMLTSIEAGRRTEIDAIHGGLVRRAAELGVAVPALETCYRLALLRGVRA